MEDINISGADFGSNLPKWATDETLKKLLLLSNKDSTRTKKEHEKIVALLGRFASKSDTTSKSISTELKEIKTILKNGLKTPTAKDKSNEGVEKLLKDTNKNLEKLNDSSKEKTTGNNASVEKLLQTINKTLKDISVGTSKSIADDAKNKIVGRATGKAPVGSKQSVSSPVNTSRERIKNRIGKGSFADRVEQSQSNKSRIGGQLEAILNRVGNGTMGTRTMKTGKKVGSAMGKMSGISKALIGFTRMLPVIGGVITALSSVAAIFTIIADSAKKFAWDAQREVKGMLKSGFSFGVETIGQGIKMDGIKLHKMINQSGLTTAEGLAMMEKNAVLMNNMGVAGVFKSIDTVAEYQEAGSKKFQDQMLLSRQEIGEFTTQYLASTMNIIRTEKSREFDRAAAARNYIKDARLFGQVTGQGMQTIIDRMNEMRKTDDYRLAMLSRDGEDAKVLETALTAFSSMNIGDGTRDMIMKALLDTRGLGMGVSEEGSEMRAALASMVGTEDTMKLDNLMRDVQLGNISQEEFLNSYADITEQFKEGTIQVNREQAKALLSAGNANEKAAAQLILGWQQADGNAIRNGAGGTDADQMSDLQNKQQAVESQIAASRAIIEGAAIDVADSDGARKAMETTLDVMRKAAELGGNIVESLLGSILKTLISGLGSLMSGLSALLGFFRIKTKEEKAIAKSNSDGLKEIYSATNKEHNNMDNIRGRIDKEAGVEGAGLFSRGDRDEKFPIYAKELLEKAKAGDDEALDFYKDMLNHAGTQVSHNERKVLRGLLTEEMEKGETNKENIIDLFKGRQYRNAPKSDDEDLPYIGDWTPFKDNTEFFENNPAFKPTTKQSPIEEVIPSDMKPATTQSPIEDVLPSDMKPVVKQSPVGDVVRETTDKQYEAHAKEQARREEEKMEKDKRIQEQTRRETESKTTETTTTNTNTPVIVNQGDGISTLVAGINTLNNRVDELVRLQKEFNSEMTISIIRA